MRAFRSGAAMMTAGLIAHAPPLDREPEHMDLVRQHDLVTRYRVAIRLYLARVYKEAARPRAHDDRVLDRAFQAGTYFAEYRRHYRHLRTLPGFRPQPTYG